MKKIIVLLAFSLALAACCAGPDGNVYLSFDWTYAPEWFITDDPSLPYTIYRKANYLTDEGTYYFEYYHDESGYIRWITYTLTAHDGFYGIRGEDAQFELFLSAFGNPDLIQWQSVSGPAAEGEPDAIAAHDSPPRPGEQRVPTFEQSMTSGTWMLSIEGGFIEPAPK